jgi:hypothetical protein
VNGFRREYSAVKQTINKVHNRLKAEEKKYGRKIRTKKEIN